MTDITPAIYTSENSIDVTMPGLTHGSYSVNITNSIDTLSTPFTVLYVPSPGDVVVPLSQITIFAPQVEIKASGLSGDKVDNDRLINLRNFLPTSFDGSEVSDFVGFFEDFLNYDLYTHKIDSEASTLDISILKKIELLYTLRDPTLIDEKFIQYFAKQLGYNIKYNKSDIFNVTGDTNANDINGYLRQTVQSLPHWYKFKSTNNALTMLMYSFGIVSDILTLWTNDYENNWISESPRFEQDINTPPMEQGYYPTPHYRIVVNTTRTPKGWESNLSNIISMVDSIKPINTVFEGFSLKVVINGINPGFDTADVRSTPIINSIKIGTSTMLNTQTP
tara:strand:- start:5396 stop:6400 length:1005 start_codon:yes stop_codon:yes gene_type:complete